MKLIKAGPTQDQVLKDFFNKQVMSGHIDYRLERPNSFFSQYQALTPDYSTYVLQNDQQEIGAMASVLFRKGYVNHQEQMVGYVTDLRVQASRGATLNWEQAFMPVLEKEMEERNCRYLFSTLEQYESQAYNTLLRRRKRPGGLPRYHLFRRFFQVAILGKRFFADEPLSTIEISRANLSDIEAIAEYLREKSVGKPLYFDLPPEEIERRCHQWPEFSIESFFLAKNRRGKIIGCMAPWNNSSIQKWIPHRYHGKSFRAYNTVNTLAKLRLLRPLPKENHAFAFKFVTHGAYDNPDIFYSLLDRCYQESEPNEILSYSNYIGDYSTRPPRSFVSIKIPFGFYTLLRGSETLPHFLQPNPFLSAPDFQFAHF